MGFCLYAFFGNASLFSFHNCEMGLHPVCSISYRLLHIPFTIVKWDFILYVLFHTAFYIFLSQLWNGTSSCMFYFIPPFTYSFHNCEMGLHPVCSISYRLLHIPFTRNGFKHVVFHCIMRFQHGLLNDIYIYVFLDCEVGFQHGVLNDIYIYVFLNCEVGFQHALLNDIYIYVFLNCEVGFQHAFFI